MISREQVANLQPGDVVEVHRVGWPEGATVRGALYGSDGGAKGLWVGDLMVRHHDGDAFAWQVQEESTLTVVSRAPRPLYVNHPRTEPVPGDVVRDADGKGARVWIFTGPVRPDYPGWASVTGGGAVQWARPSDVDYPQVPTRLRLLVDGETGRVVQ